MRAVSVLQMQRSNLRDLSSKRSVRTNSNSNSSGVTIGMTLEDRMKSPIRLPDVKQRLDYRDFNVVKTMRGNNGINHKFDSKKSKLNQIYSNIEQHYRSETALSKYSSEDKSTHLSGRDDKPIERFMKQRTEFAKTVLKSYRTHKDDI